MKPLARRDGLVIRSLADETLVYDRERHQAHCLNPAAASVFRLCDGEHSAGEIALLLGATLDPTARSAIVSTALTQLAEARLLAGEPADLLAAPAVPPATPAKAVDASRRELLLRVGAALLVPAIASIVAPTPAEAASAACVPDYECFGIPANRGKRCWAVNPSDCGPNNCCDDVLGCLPIAGCSP